MNNFNIAIFASGSGSNAENIVTHLSANPHYRVELILSNKNDAFVLERAKRLHIKHLVFTKEDLYTNSNIEKILVENKIDVIILAGFLLRIPENLINLFPSRIINIHPALLPKYGGKGMFGMNVHKAIIEAKESFSGITIHLVDEIYDHGSIIFQAQCPIEKDDTPEILAQKIHALEAKYFPSIIEKFLDSVGLKGV